MKGTSTAEASQQFDRPTAMREPIETAVRTANTPAQAKVFVAMLQAEGIPARVDGESLTDEFAASRRLMNLAGVKVMVPTSSLPRAREILQPVQVDPDELEREAMAAAGERAAPVETDRASAARPMSLAWLLLLAAVGAAVVFAFLWQQQARKFVSPAPDLDYAWDGDALRETLRRDGRLMRLLFDRDHDQMYERIEQFDPAGKRVMACDRYEGGLYRRYVESRSGDLEVTWTDEDRDGLSDVAVVTDRSGNVVQRIEWRAGTGFVLQPR
jgi:hypothetical protein